MTTKPKAVSAVTAENAVPAPEKLPAHAHSADAAPVAAVPAIAAPAAAAPVAPNQVLLAPPAPKTFTNAVEALKQNADTATATLHTGAQQTQSKVKQGVDRAMKTAEQLAQFHQGNIEAVMKSGQIWASGLQDLSKHVASNAQATMEETMSTFRAMTGVKSLKEAFELQSSFARAAMEKALAESSKLTETGMKLAEQASAPITARVNAAVEVFTNRT